MIGHKPVTVLDPKMILEVIENGIKQGDHVYVLFLESSAIEGYLSSLIQLSGIAENSPKKNYDCITNIQILLERYIPTLFASL